MVRDSETANLEADADLLARFVASFTAFDDLYDFQALPTLLAGTDESGLQRGQPRRIATSPSALGALYRSLSLSGRGSARFPSLYEALLLSYRWAKVVLGSFSLLANEPAEDLSPLLAAMRADASLFPTLVANGYHQFGQGPDTDYDPVCFDFRHRQKNGDCRIAKLDHEAILCYDRIREVGKLAPNFRSLVLETVRHAETILKNST